MHLLRGRLGAIFELLQCDDPTYRCFRKSIGVPLQYQSVEIASHNLKTHRAVTSFQFIEGSGKPPRDSGVIVCSYSNPGDSVSNDFALSWSAPRSGAVRRKCSAPDSSYVIGEVSCAPNFRSVVSQSFCESLFFIFCIAAQ